MKVSHFAIIPKEVYKFLEEPDAAGPGRGTLGIVARVVDGTALVVDLEPDSPAEKGGVKTGWEILRIGERDIPERLAELATELADNPKRRTILSSALSSRLITSIGNTIEIEFRDADDQREQRSLTAVAPRGRKSRFGNLPEFWVHVDVRRLEPDIGYIQFNAFMDPPYLMVEFNKAMRSFMDADGVIIDIRGNGGGLGEMAAGMIGWLIGEEKEKLGTIVLRGLELKMLAPPRAKRYNGPVALLVDEMSASAAEFMASGMKDLGCARLFGSRTAGAVLGSRVERLPNGDGFQYAAMNFISAKSGNSLEGIGVEPDEEVKQTRAALLEGRDLVLESAKEWIQKESGKN